MCLQTESIRCIVMRYPAGGDGLTSSSLVGNQMVRSPCVFCALSYRKLSIGCMLHTYQEKEVKSCLRSSRLVFIGDSVTRQLFFQFARSIDSNLPTGPPSDDQKHADYTLHSTQDVQLTFHWDPFLNTSTTQSYTLGLSTAHPQPPALLVLGSGLWYLRYSDSGGLPEWEAMMESTLESQGLLEYCLGMVPKPMPTEPTLVGPTLGRPDTKGKGERKSIDRSDLGVRAVFAVAQ